MAPKDRTVAAQGIASLLPKLTDPDPDIRFMQLNDLANILNSSASEYLRTESHTVARLIDALLRALGDTNGEVQNQALKCVGPLATRTPGEHILAYIDKLVDLTNKDIDVSVPNSAIRTLITTLPQPGSGAGDRDVREAHHGISKVLIPRLVGYSPLKESGRGPQTKVPPGLLQQQKDKGFNSDAMDVMIEVVRCFGSVLTEVELGALAKAAMEVVINPHAGGVVKKRALAGIGAVVTHYTDPQLDGFITYLADSFSASKLSANQQRFLIAAFGTLARSVPKRVGQQMKTHAPLVLRAISEDELAVGEDDDEHDIDSDTIELREAALVTLEAMLAGCPAEMEIHQEAIVDSTLRCIRYDPNVVEIDDEEMGGTQDADSEDGITEEAQDDDDEYAELDDEAAFSDVDDMSWKIRKCAAKTLQTIISGTVGPDYGSLFGRVMPVLIIRLNNEREDSVRFEVISAITLLIQKSGLGMEKKLGRLQNGMAQDNVPTMNSRKRRRQDSQSQAIDSDLRGLVQTRASPPIEPPSPPSGHGAHLANVVPKIVQAVVKLWKTASISLKQGSVIMLRTIVLSRNGALEDHLQQLEDPIADALKPSTSITTSSTAGASATVASLQIATLNLISTITETNSNQALIPFVIALIPPVTGIVSDRNFKVVEETLATIEQFVKAVTPPRLPEANKDHAIHLQKLYDVIIVPVGDMNVDLDIRHRAIQVLGVIVARTSGTGLLPQAARMKSLGMLNDRLKNETTRIESARAIGLVAEAARPQDSMGSEWIQEVSLEMANQLRKADRALRASCLESIQYMALNPVTASQYDTKTIQQLQALLMPLIVAEDLHLLTPALVVLSRIIPTNAQALVTDEVVRSLCLLTRARLEGPPLKAYLLVVKVIGEQGVGASLMKGLLSIGTDGDTLVLGRAIGTLIVYGGTNVGVSVDDFLREVESSKDSRAQCLALTVLGEVGYRMGNSSVVDLDVFINSLSADQEKVRLAAAVALGSASSSNTEVSLPLILNSFGTSTSQDYLYLHALKEILQHSESAAADLAPYSADLWQKIFAVANTEDNRAIGAECLGRLATTKPSVYIPELSKALEDQSSTIRHTVIAAFRFTLSDNSGLYNEMLGDTIVSILNKMISDTDLNNRRLAITALNAAIHNKPDFIIPDIGKLLPVVSGDTYVKPELIKTVKIGPFTHQEDSGIDLRKAAYGTLYTLLDTPQAIPYLSMPLVFQRVVDGVADDHDIRTLCNLMLQRLITIDPTETRRSLPALAEKFKVVLSTKLKENAVKQEIEKVNEANSAIIRMSLELERSFPSANSGDVPGEMVGWKHYLDYVKKEFAQTVRSIAAENA